MSQFFIKLLDNSLFPASVMILGKLIGVLGTLYFFNIPFTIRDYFSQVYSSRFIVQSDYISVVTSYSDIVMYFILALVFSIFLVRAIFFHDTHLKPSVITKLANSNLLSLVKSSYEIYQSAIVWLIFLWISNFLIIVNVFSGNTYLWIGVVCTIFSLFFTTLLFQDVYREIENIKRKPGGYLLN